MVRGRGSRGPRLQPSGWRSDSPTWGEGERCKRCGRPPHCQGHPCGAKAPSYEQGLEGALSRDFSGDLVAKTPHSQVQVAQVLSLGGELDPTGHI